MSEAKKKNPFKKVVQKANEEQREIYETNR